MLPDYVTRTKPNPAANRAPWYTNTAPTYAGVFLWVVFYMEIAKGTLDRAGVGPVSYTHLDVYKRQVPRRAIRSRIGFRSGYIIRQHCDSLPGAGAGP